jgi:hypothetical protein
LFQKQLELPATNIVPLLHSGTDTYMIKKAPATALSKYNEVPEDEKNV